MSLKVQIPTTVRQLDQVRDLMRSFITWHKDRHREDIHLIDAYFDARAFEQELASLPGNYVPPHGQLLLATLEGRPAGCVALREIDPKSCEMKRMFVYTDLHGKGVGRALAKAIVQEARTLGYATMRLDTSIHQDEAKGLYKSLGFQIIEPYYALPEDLKNWLVFMELNL
jgi:GNAT superfamily N-acetyltransferase